MSKQEVISFIMEINRGAKEDFLDQFQKEELDIYLEHLLDADVMPARLVA